jgi:prepilin-type processing-associated H-X9-DG protein
MYRHSEGAGVIFCDGHAEYRKKTALFYFLDGNDPDLSGSNIDWFKNDRIWRYFQ